MVRKLTRKGVDVVFEHTGADTWAGSLLSLKRGGRLVTCGATSGPTASINLMQLFQQQYRIIGSFGAPMSALARALERIASGVRPVIDTVYGWTISAPAWTGWKPGRVRQAPGRTLTGVRRQLALYGDRILGRMVKWLHPAVAPHRPGSRIGFVRRGRAADRPAAAGAPDRPGQFARRVSRQGRGVDRGDASRSLGQSRPRRRRVCASGADLGLRYRASQHRPHPDRQRAAVRDAADRRQAGAVLLRASGELGTAGDRRRRAWPAIGGGLPHAEQQGGGEGDHPHPRAL